MIEFYGAPPGLSDEDIDSVYDGNDSACIHIGTLFGTLVLGSQMYRDGENLYLACDDMDGDLEYVVSSFIETGIITEGEGECIDFFYINELVMEEPFDTFDLKVRILDSISETVFCMCGVKPSVTAYYPLPLDYEEDPVFRIKHDMAQIAAADILKRRLMPGDSKSGDAGMHLTLDEDQLNYILGRRIPAETYPETAKDPEIWELYREAGFEEAAGTRLLYKRSDG